MPVRSFCLRPSGFVLFLVLLMGFTLPPASAQSIRGTVTDATGQPLPGVNVVATPVEPSEEARSRGASTAPDGSYALTDLSNGRYRVRASAVGYQPATETVRLEGPQPIMLDFTLTTTRYGLEEVVVSAARGAESVGSVASAVSVLPPEALQEQTALTSDLGDILAQSVPGLATTSGTLSNFGQTLRGRDAFVLIDGVPQNTPLRSAQRALRTVNPDAIERIEVQRGANALYGYGATGGAINIITRRPEAGALNATTEIGSRGSGADLGESFSGHVRQVVSGRNGRFDYLVSGQYERTGHFFDAEGDLIPQDPHGQGGLSGSDALGVLAKTGAQLTDQQRLELAFSYYELTQDIEFATTPGTYGNAKTTADPLDDFPGNDPGTENLLAQLTYRHENVGGSNLRVTGYLQDFRTRFGFFSFFPDGGGQTVTTSEKLGARVDLETPLARLTRGTALAGSQLLWGIDALRDETAQPLVDGRTYVPPMTQTSAAPFAQLRLNVGQRVTLRAGARHEALRLNVDDFATLFGGNNVAGGTLTYGETVFNAGAIVRLADPVDAFASFGQGFNVGDVGRILRSTEAPSVEAIDPEAQVVNSYELGLRTGTPVFDASATGFVNTSDLGSTFGTFPELQLTRAPERIYGIELTTDIRPVQRLSVGGTFTWLEGKRDADDDGDYEQYLTGDRIPPLKLTGYVQGTLRDGWTARLQMLHSGSRDRFDGEPNVDFARGPVDAYTLFGVTTTVDAGPGALEIGIENLFDTFYYPAVSQWYHFDSAYTPGRGRNLSLSYTLTW